jgi:hypothetical protein
MLYKTLSAAVYGIDANIIEVEVDVSGVKCRKTTFTLSDCRMLPSAKAATASARR